MKRAAVLALLAVGACGASDKPAKGPAPGPQEMAVLQCAGDLGLVGRTLPIAVLKGVDENGVTKQGAVLLAERGITQAQADAVNACATEAAAS